MSLTILLDNCLGTFLNLKSPCQSQIAIILKAVHVIYPFYFIYFNCLSWIPYISTFTVLANSK